MGLQGQVDAAGQSRENASLIAGLLAAFVRLACSLATQPPCANITTRFLSTSSRHLDKPARCANSQSRRFQRAPLLYAFRDIASHSAIVVFGARSITIAVGPCPAD